MCVAHWTLDWNNVLKNKLSFLNKSPYSSLKNEYEILTNRWVSVCWLWLVRGGPERDRGAQFTPKKTFSYRISKKTRGGSSFLCHFSHLSLSLSLSFTDTHTNKPSWSNQFGLRQIYKHKYKKSCLNEYESTTYVGSDIFIFVIICICDAWILNGTTAIRILFRILKWIASFKFEK